MTSQKAIEKNIEKQLYLTTRQNNELAKTKIEKILKYKLQIFTKNLIDSGSIKKGQTDYTELIKLIEYFKRENFIQIIGVIVGDEGIFIDEKEERMDFDKKVIYDILLNDKNIFQYTINDKDYLIVKNTEQDDSGNEITTLYMQEDKVRNNELIIPAYTDLGYSFVVDKEGNTLFYSTIDASYVRLSNYFEDILGFSPKNLDAVNKLKIDFHNNSNGIVRYEKNESKRLMSYIPIGVEDLYLCIVIPEDVITHTVDEFKMINKISLIIMIVDVLVLFAFFKFIDINKNKNINNVLNLDTVTNGNSYKKFQDDLKKIYNKKDIKAIYMAIDLDNFKIVNTVLGKECGDIVLKKIYEILQFHIGNNGCYCRNRADEFLAYYEYKDTRDVEHIVNSICEAIRHIRLPKSHILVPSIGIYYIDNKELTLENLEINATIAKNKCKNKINEFYSYFKDGNLDEIIDSKSILDEMNNALVNKEFRLVYQPKFDAKTKKIVGAEALIRWTKSDNTTVFPNQFIPIAEKTGFITFIDSYVFKETCEKQAKWLQQGYTIVPISVNLSREKVQDPNFLYEYLQIVRETGIEKDYVQLEITEGDTYTRNNVKTNIVDSIKDAGFKVLIDDFGVGYSSLTMLKDIRADVIKLDRSFVIDESSTGKALLKYIIKIAKVFNYKIVAEGVETEEQFNFLKEECDEIQGYYFSKPLEEKEFVDEYLKDL